MKYHTFLGVILVLSVWQSETAAVPPDFSICDGQAGVALGLCHGGVAAGCATSGGGTVACLAIEQKYSTVTGGSDAPWISLRYPVNTLTLEIAVGVDLESGIASIAPHVINLYPNFSYCQEVGNCDRLDLVADIWEETAGDSGNPFLFWQRPCTDPNEPGVGGQPEFVLLRGVAFSDTTSSNIDSSTFQEATYSGGGGWGELPHLGSGDTLIVHTCAGNYFKVGNQACKYKESTWPMCGDPSLAEFWTRFDYQMLRPAP